MEEGLVFEYGEEVEFKCDNGYSMASSGLLRCTEDGWSDSIPQCHPISCPIPISIRHGTITGDDFSFGASINYECDEGYELFGVTSRTCQESKEWTDIEPYCRIIECPRPAPLVNGQMIGESVKYQSVLSYMCDPGFRLEGVHSRWDCCLWGSLGGVYQFVSTIQIVIYIRKYARLESCSEIKQRRYSKDDA